MIASFAVGSRFEQPGEEGLAHFIEHLLFKGTKRWPDARALSEAVEGVGADFNAATGFERTSYLIQAGRNEAEASLEVLKDMVTAPRFDPDDIERERGVVIEEINDYADRIGAVVASEARKLLWPSSALGKPILGNEQSISSMSKETITGFFTGAYQPERMLIGLGGAVDDQLADKASALFSFPGRSGWREIDQPKEGSERLVVVPREEANQTQLCFLLPVTDYVSGDHKRALTCDILGMLLGGAMSSRLFQTVREQHSLAYSIHAYYRQHRNAGFIAIDAGVDSSRAPQAVALIVDELKRLASDGVPEEELQRIVRFNNGYELRESELPFSRMMSIWDNLLDWGRPIDIDERIEVYNSIASDDLEELTQIVFTPDALRLAVAGRISEPINEQLLRL